AEELHLSRVLPAQLLRRTPYNRPAAPVRGAGPVDLFGPVLFHLSQMTAFVVCVDSSRSTQGRSEHAPSGWASRHRFCANHNSAIDHRIGSCRYSIGSRILVQTVVANAAK